MAKRWTIPFVSMANKQCRIDIYDPSWTGSVTELSTNNGNAPGVPAADPFYFEEDDDEDLLQVVRIKTGYINLIEIVQDGLTDIYPTSLKSRYIEAFYDNAICFRGYIQQQSFENDWAAVPREVSLPVVSVMGIAESLKFTPNFDYARRKLGSYMKQVLDLVEPSEGTKYAKVIFPQNNVDFAGDVRQIVITPPNKNFSQAIGTTDAAYEGIYLNEFLEGVCNAYGWIMHDMTTSVLFTMFDSPANYYAYNVSDLASASNIQLDTTQEDLSLDTSMSPSSDDSTITQIMPMKKLTLNYQGENPASVTMDYNLCRCTKFISVGQFGPSQTLEPYGVAIFEPVGHEVVSYSNYLKTDGRIYVGTTNRGRFYDNGIYIAECFDKKRIVMQNVPNFINQSELRLVQFRFDTRPLAGAGSSMNTPLTVEIDFSWGQNLQSLGYEGSVHQIEITIYDGYSWQTISPALFSDESNHIVKAKFYNVSDRGSIWVTLAIPSGTSIYPHDITSIDSIKLYYPENEFDKYIKHKDVVVLEGNNAGISDNDIDVLMSCWCDNLNMIGTTRLDRFTDYQYMFLPQNRLQLRMRPKSGQAWPGIAAYIDKIQFWKTNWRWRLIALTFHPWDDEWMLTMHRSSTIE